MTYTERHLQEQGEPAGDQRAFRRCLGQFSTGVTVITTQSAGQPVGVTANSFSSLSMDPPLILWSIGRGSRSYAAFATAKHFAVNILSADQIELSQLFASRTEDKFAGVDWYAGALGSPVLRDVVAVLDCELEASLDGGDHLILVGRVRSYARFSGSALLYAQGRYAIAEDHPTLLTRSTHSVGDALNGKPEAVIEPTRFTTMLALVGMYASVAFDKFRQGEGIDLPQGRVLFALRNGNTATLDQIVTQSYLTRISAEDALTSLEERQCVTCLEGRFALTESGQELRAKLAPQFDRFEAVQLAGIPAQDLAVAQGVLHTLHARLRSEASVGPDKERERDRHVCS